MTHWYAAVVKRQRERAACEALTAAGFVAWVPMEMREKRQPRKRLARKPERYIPEKVETVEVPVIRGIAIIGSPAELSRNLDVWWGLTQVRYPRSDDAVVRAIYGNGGVPVQIREGEIAAMLAEAGKRVDDLLGGGVPKFKADESVRMLAGAFEGLPATVKELPRQGARRYVVLAQLFGRETPVEVDEADIEAWAAE